MEKNVKRKLIQTLVWAVTAVVIGIVIQQFLHSKNAVAQDLKNTSDSVNKYCPVWIDSITRFDNTTVLPGNTFQYNYSLKLDTALYAVADLKAALEKTLMEQIRSDSSFEAFRENKVTLAFNYTDEQGHFLFREEFRPEQYLKK